MENNNGKGLFYGVIGVATLIVAIIGATFAYFTATTTSGQYLSGQAAVAGLEVAVTRLTTYSKGEVDESGQTVGAEAAKYIMVPQLDATIDQAIIGASGQSGAGLETNPNKQACIDANGTLVCTIYKITVTNTGSSAIDVSGEIKFYGGPTEGPITDGEDDTPYVAGESVMNHLKWARLTNPTDVSGTTLPTTLLNYATDQSYSALRPVAENGATFANTSATPYLYGMSITSNANDLYGAAYSGLLDSENGGYLATVDTNGNGQLEESELANHWVTKHDAHYDLIDPTDDQTYASDTKIWTTNTSAKNKYGTVHLEAAGTTINANNDGVTDDTATFYIVVWISENLAKQNDVDTGTFVGQVTFNSAAGSGATSTFTEVYSG